VELLSLPLNQRQFHPLASSSWNSHSFAVNSLLTMQTLGDRPGNSLWWFTRAQGAVVGK